MGLGLTELRPQALALGLEMPGPYERPGMASPLSHVSMVPSVPMWDSKHSQVLAGRPFELAMPCGESSGSVASSDSRLYSRIWLMPPILRCLSVPSAGSGKTMKVTWASPMALDAFL